MVDCAWLVVGGSATEVSGLWSFGGQSSVVLYYA